MIRFAVANSVVWNLRLESERRVDNLSNFSEPQFRESVIEHRGRCGAHNGHSASTEPTSNQIQSDEASLQGGTQWPKVRQISLGKLPNKLRRQPTGCAR